jgi:hypothetical protein
MNTYVIQITSREQFRAPPHYFDGHNVVRDLNKAQRFDTFAEANRIAYELGRCPSFDHVLLTVLK